jgi:tetratricopeptide (TPR) repeat protein
MRRGDYAGAIASFERARKLAPNYSVVQVNLGIARGAIGQNAVADAHFRRALELAPRMYSAMFYYARWLIDRSRGPEALQLLQSSLAISPANPDTRRLLSRVLAALGNRTALAALVEGTLEIDPADPTARAIARGRLPFAAEATGAEAYRELGLQKIGAKAWLDAAASYQQMIVLAPGSTEAWNNLG